MRSDFEGPVARFFHQRYGVVLYPYPGIIADLQTSCGLNIEVKKESRHRLYCFKGEQIFRKQFDIAILVRERKRGWYQYLEWAIWPLPAIQALIIAKDGLPHIKGPNLHLRPPESLEWHRLEYRCLDKAMISLQKR